MTSEDEKHTSSNSGVFNNAQDEEIDQEKSDGIALPAHVAGSGALDRLVDTARDYARQATSENTNKAYMNRPGFTGGQNFRRIAHYGTVTQQEDLEAVFT